MEIIDSIGIRKGLYDFGADLIQAAEDLPEREWTQQGANLDRGYARERSILSISVKAMRVPLFQHWDASVSAAFNLGVVIFTDGAGLPLTGGSTGNTILRYRKGDSMGEHVDPGYKVSGLIFLNENFKGGDLIFPRQRLRIKPESGMGVFYPRGEDFPHYVEPVLEGTRYVVCAVFGEV